MCLCFITISVSETGPKLVTKMLVWISVTFSVRRKKNRYDLKKRVNRKQIDENTHICYPALYPT